VWEVFLEGGVVVQVSAAWLGSRWAVTCRAALVLVAFRRIVDVAGVFGGSSQHGVGLWVVVLTSGDVAGPVPACCPPAALLLLVDAAYPRSKWRWRWCWL
jgi:hypothetical protein